MTATLVASVTPQRADATTLKSRLHHARHHLRHSRQRLMDARAALARYEKRVRRATQFYWRMVEAYYTQPFMELFLQPGGPFDIPASVNAVPVMPASFSYMRK